MSFDERALLLEQAHRSLHPPQRSAWLDGPIWFLGPLFIIAALAFALAAIPWPTASDAAPRIEHVKPDRHDPDAIAWSSASYSKN